MRQKRPTLAAVAVISAAVLGTVVPAGAASAEDVPEGHVATDSSKARAGAERTFVAPPLRAIENVRPEGFDLWISPKCSLDYGCAGMLYVAGANQRIYPLAEDTFHEWPSYWKEGETRSDLYALSVAKDVFGNWGWNDKSKASLGSVTRPYTVRAVTASVSSVDNGGRSAVLRGTATPGADVKVSGSKIATADSSGSWSGTVSGLRTGVNDLTVVQRIYGKDQNRTSVSVTVTSAISARLLTQDDDAKTAAIAGSATPGAAIRLGGTQVATASSGGSWTATVSGLSVGGNSRTFEQYVNGSFVDSTSVSITIADPSEPDPGLPDRIVGDTGATDLIRGETGSVTATFTPKSPVGKPSGTATFTAPEGTTFAAGQDTLRGQVLRDGAWKDFDADTLVQGKRSSDGKTYEYTLAERDLGVAADQQFRWTVRVAVPAGLSATTGELTARLEGSIDAGTFDTTARTTTTFVDAEAPFTATATFPDDVTQRAVVSGDGEPGARVDLRQGSTEVVSTTVGTDGKWSVHVPAPNAGGVRDYTAVQTIGTTPSGSVPVRIDYGIAAWIVSPGNGYQISPYFPNVRVSGFAAPGSRVVVSEEGTSTVFGSTTADADGRWAITTPRLQQREYSVLATATGPGANTTTAKVALAPSR